MLSSAILKEDKGGLAFLKKFLIRQAEFCHVVFWQFNYTYT